MSSEASSGLVSKSLSFFPIWFGGSLASQPLRLEEEGSGDTVTHFVALRNAITALSGFIRKCVTNVK